MLLDQCRVPTCSVLLLLPVGISAGIQRARLSPQRPPRAGNWLLPCWKGSEDTQESVSAFAVCPFSEVIPRCMSSFSIGRCVLFVCRLIILWIFPLKNIVSLHQDKQPWETTLLWNPSCKNDSCFPSFLERPSSDQGRQNCQRWSILLCWYLHGRWLNKVCI